MTIRPTKKTQMVLGTNGSGKSSLLKFIMTVIPPDKSHFHTGGHKIIKILDNGNKYRLETQYEKNSPKHSFICNGEELNKGGTGAVMKELIRQHFNITEEVHNVLSGITKFTEMSSLERRDWITRLSTTDFGYVLEFFNRVKRGSRDQDALIRNARARIAEEKPKLLDDEQELSLLQRSSSLHNSLDALIKECNKMPRLQQDTVYELQQRHTELERRIGAFLRGSVVKSVEGYRIESIEDLHHHIKLVREKLSHHDSVMSVLGDQLSNVEIKLQDVRSISGMDDEFVRTELERSLRESEELFGQLRTNLSPKVLADVQRNDLVKVNEIRVALMEITTSIAERFNDDSHLAARKELDRLIEEHHRLHGNISSVEGRLDHIHNCQAVQCPKCQHDFKPGVGEHELEVLVSGVTKEKTQLSKLVERMDELRNYVGEAQVYRGKISEIERMRMHERGLSTLWSYIDDLGGFSKGVALTSPIMDFIEDVKTSWKIKELSDKIELYRESLNRFQAASANGRAINDQYVLLKSQVEETTRQINFLQDEHTKLQECLTANQRIDEMYKVLCADVRRINELKEELVEQIRSEHVNEAIEAARNSLAAVNNTLGTQQAQKYLVQDITREHAKAMREQEVLKKMEAALSPKDGMIAEQISMFVNVVIGKINEVIARVWGFNMALFPLDLDEKSMDYKFPMYNGTKDNDCEDISKGSDSMCEIINQAFRMVVYKMMGLRDFPLYIDELGKGFDPVHRANLVFAIKDMIDDPMYSQVFIISHYEDGQNSYPNSEIIVTDDTHVSLTREYNQHVVFE